MEIRRAQLAEAESLANLFLRSFRSALPTVKLAHTDDETRQWYRDHLLPETDTWVFIREGKIVGFISLSASTVEQLYVDSRETGKGVGARLIETAKQIRPKGLSLATFAVNIPARRFYEKHGFKHVRSTDGSNNEEHEPDVYYEWKPTKE
ncbi:MAG TPA: GNAT family N-acetyltransferase [Candidatus Saccharimonadia bacterium]|nr:GNAT family N-acetyltransferase [Candidatus Saccharimonadia bacterium]